jgi:hypothetical protein
MPMMIGREKLEEEPAEEESVAPGKGGDGVVGGGELVINTETELADVVVAVMVLVMAVMVVVVVAVVFIVVVVLVGVVGHTGAAETSAIVAQQLMP